MSKFIDTHERKVVRARLKKAAVIAASEDVYFENEQIGKTQFALISRTRDSGILDISNWEVITADMLKRFPKTCHIERASHWACGWLETLYVNAYSGTQQPERLTSAAVAAVEWIDSLRSYPVADDDDYSRREMEALREHVADYHIGRHYIGNGQYAAGLEWVENRPENWVDLFLTEFWDMNADYHDGDGVFIREKDYKHIVVKLGLAYDPTQLGPDDEAPTWGDKPQPINNPEMYYRPLL